MGVCMTKDTQCSANLWVTLGTEHARMRKKEEDLHVTGGHYGAIDRFPHAPHYGSDTT